MDGSYVYVLPNETMYKRVSTPSSTREMMQVSGVLSITFSGNIGVIKTRTGYASAIAWNIDAHQLPQILGTVAGADTILFVVKEGVTQHEVIDALSTVIQGVK
jgi:transcriptional regulator of arginine metabolism